MDDVERLQEMWRKAMPKDMTAAAQLMAYPAAMSAIGVGIASQAMANWLVAMASAAEASQRLMQAGAAARQAGESQVTPASSRADKAAKAILDDARTVARDAALEGAAVANAVAKAKKAISGMSGKTPTTPELAEQADPIAPEDFRRPAVIDRPEAPDDLKAIAGVGPKLEQVLNGLGIWTYAQIAAWSPQEICWIEEMLGTRGRIGRDGWVAQAAVLASGAM